MLSEKSLKRKGNNKITVSKTKEQVYLEKVKKDGLSLKEIKENQTEAICLIDLSLSPYHVLEQLYLR